MDPAHSSDTMDEPSPFLEPSDPAGAIEILRSFDNDELLEGVKKARSTIRKWQKMCKKYREQAKEKIAFRNFSEGDLALLLPTRNSKAKPWGAFNVSHPYHFLKVTGDLAEQLKTREWFIGRITSKVEQVVEPNIPDGNPYGLGDGVKYYLLEVEDWTTKPHSSKHPAKDLPPQAAEAETTGDVPEE